MNDRPCRYDLAYQNNALELSVPPVYYSQVRQLVRADGNLVKTLSEYFKFTDKFAPPSRPKWGFGRTLHNDGTNRSGWHVIRAPLPVLVPDKPDTTLTKNSYLLNASLVVLLTALGFDWNEKKTTKPQKLQPLVSILDINAQYGRWGCTLSAYVHPGLCRWIKSRMSEVNRQIVLNAMIEAFFWMWSRSKSFYQPKYDFRILARGSSCWLSLQVPGDACDLSPDGHEHLDQGYRLVPHNTDNPIQQLTFLVALAKLNELARLDGY